MNRFKNTLIMSFASLFILSGCGGSSNEEVKGEGVAQLDTRNVSTFNSVIVDGQYQIAAEVGTPQTLTITSNANILPYIETTVNNKVLHIDNKSKVRIQPTVQQKISFKAPEIDAVTLAGESTFYLANINNDKLDVSLAGAHQLMLAGKTEKLRITVDGISNVDAKALTAKNIEVVINGAGNIAVNPTKSLNAIINGSGKIINVSKTATVNETIHGSGQVQNNK